MDDQQQRDEIADDQQTQRLVRRPSAPLPAGLDPAKPARTSADPTTDVLSLDELMDIASRRDPEPRPRRPAAPAAHVAPTPPAAPTRTAAAAMPSGPSPFDELRRQLLEDAARAWVVANERARAWLRRGDNALIAVTMLVTIFFVAVIAVAG